MAMARSFHSLLTLTSALFCVHFPPARAASECTSSSDPVELISWRNDTMTTQMSPQTNWSCEWRISGHPGEQIHVSIGRLTGGPCDTNGLAFYDGRGPDSPRLSPSCPVKMAEVTSSGAAMFVTLQPGFSRTSITYKALSNSGGTFNYDDMNNNYNSGGGSGGTPSTSSSTTSSISSTSFPSSSSTSSSSSDGGVVNVKFTIGIVAAVVVVCVLSVVLRRYTRPCWSRPNPFSGMRRLARMPKQRSHQSQPRIHLSPDQWAAARERARALERGPGSSSPRSASPPQSPRHSRGVTLTPDQLDLVPGRSQSPCRSPSRSRSLGRNPRSVVTLHPDQLERVPGQSPSPSRSPRRSSRPSAAAPPTITGTGNQTTRDINGGRRREDEISASPANRSARISTSSGADRGYANRGFQSSERDPTAPPLHDDLSPPPYTSLDFDCDRQPAPPPYTPDMKHTLPIEY